MNNPTDIREQEQRKADADLKALLARETEDDDVRWLMSCRQGRRIVWRQLSRAGVFRLSFSSDPLAMSFAEGNRNSGLMLMSQVMSLCPGEYAEMVKESKDDNVD